jgi:hypothetical protein
MPNGSVEANLPDRIELTLGEAADLLFALDRALELGQPGSDYHRTIQVAVRLPSRKLWPDLGDLLDEDEE